MTNPKTIALLCGKAEIRSMVLPFTDDVSSGITVTPKMAEAGLNLLEEYGRLDHGVNSGDWLLIAMIFRAMLAAAPGEPPK